jgi:hypothetical protein
VVIAIKTNRPPGELEGLRDRATPNKFPQRAELTLTSGGRWRQRGKLKAHSAKLYLDPDVIEATDTRIANPQCRPVHLISRSIPTLAHQQRPTAISTHKRLAALTYQSVSLQCLASESEILGHYVASCYMEQKVENQSG